MNGTLSDLIYEARAKDESLRLYALVTIDIDTGEILYASDLAVSLFGYTRDEMYGQEVEMLLDESVRDKHRRHRREYADNPRPRPMGHGAVLFGRPKNGILFPAQIGLSGLSQVGERRTATASLVDMTEAVAMVSRLQAMASESGVNLGGRH